MLIAKVFEGIIWEIYGHDPEVLLRLKRKFGIIKSGYHNHYRHHHSYHHHSRYVPCQPGHLSPAENFERLDGSMQVTMIVLKTNVNDVIMIVVIRVL